MFPEKSGVQVSELNGREPPRRGQVPTDTGALTEQTDWEESSLHQLQAVLSLDSRTLINSDQFFEASQGPFQPP